MTRLTRPTSYRSILLAVVRLDAGGNEAYVEVQPDDVQHNDYVLIDCEDELPGHPNHFSRFRVGLVERMIHLDPALRPDVKPDLRFVQVLNMIRPHKMKCELVGGTKGEENVPTSS